MLGMIAEVGEYTFCTPVPAWDVATMHAVLTYDTRMLDVIERPNTA